MKGIVIDTTPRSDRPWTIDTAFCGTGYRPSTIDRGLWTVMGNLPLQTQALNL